MESQEGLVNFMMSNKYKKGNTGKGAKIAIVICLAVFLFALGNILKILWEYHVAKSFYNDTVNSYVIVSDEDDSFEEEMTADKADEEDYSCPILVDFQALCLANGDIIGWIYMEDTVANYPLLQGTNNFYYLDKNYNGEYLASGSIFLDAANQNNLNDKHSIIYGHNMKNHTMFGDLGKFAEEAYLAEHPDVYVLLSDGSWYVYEIFSVYRAELTDGTYTISFNGEQDFAKFLDITMEKNMFNGLMTELPVPDEEDYILTLSTCTDDSSDTERFVIHAVRVYEEQA